MIAFAVLLRHRLPRSRLFGHIMLEPPAGEEAEVIRRHEALVDFRDLVGTRGTTTTQLTPSGKARFGDTLVDVMADGEVIGRGAAIEVVEVRGSRVLVREVSAVVSGQWSVKRGFPLAVSHEALSLNARKFPPMPTIPVMDRRRIGRAGAAAPPPPTGRTRDGPQSARLTIDGRELVNFGSNDYLGLAADPRLAEAVADALAREGWGSGASPLVTGHAALHRQLEERLAEFEGTEAALLFSSGFAANLGAIAALAGPGDVVFCDRKNHASLWDGCRLSRADVRVYPHGDCRGWPRLLEDSQQVSPAADRHRQPVQHGRRPGAAGRIGRIGRAVRRHAAGRRGPRHRRVRPARPGRGRALGRRRSRARPRRHA